MAKNYTPAGSNTTVRVLSSTSVIDVEACPIYTKPSQVYVVVQVPLDDFLAGNADSYLSTTADLIEGLLALQPPMVASAQYVSDTDASGLLAGFLAFTVSYTPSGVITSPFEATVTLPVTLFETAEAFETGVGGKNPLQIIEAAYNTLVKFAAS